MCILYIKMCLVVKFINGVEGIQSIPLRQKSYFVLKTFENE